MNVGTKKTRHLVKIVTNDGARFEGEISARDMMGFYLRVPTPMGRDRTIFVYHHSISHLEDEGWR
ncbi:hypothetical protein KAW18_00300 [candidate division WOR-3 bacterium]|nr:hypothetical protein [candidate division WOR-3 bacterium]